MGCVIVFDVDRQTPKPDLQTISEQFDGFDWDLYEQARDRGELDPKYVVRVETARELLARRVP